jgi:pimeloyl-ACP methyl ester carboxylesterase
MTIRHLEIQTNGVRLHVAEAGDPAGSLVLLLHGFPEGWFCWRKQWPALAEAGYRVWMPDQRGYGTSDKPEGVRAYRMAELTADVAGLIEAAGAKQETGARGIDAAGGKGAVVVGHDWGAVVAWRLAMERPELVGRLVILNGPADWVMRRVLWRSPRQMLRSWYAFAFQLPWLPEKLLMRDGGRKMARLLQGDARIGAFTASDLEVYREAWSQPGAMRAMVNWYRAAMRYPAAATRHRVQPKTLVLWGLRDRYLLPRLAEEGLASCDDGRLEQFDQATHWLHLEEPEAVNGLILKFVVE